MKTQQDRIPVCDWEGTKWTSEIKGSRGKEGAGLKVLRVNDSEQRRVGKAVKRCGQAGWNGWRIVSDVLCDK